MSDIRMNDHSELRISEKAAERAKIAVEHGSTEIRSGRLSEQAQLLQRDVTSLLLQAQAACLAWNVAQVVSRLVRQEPDYGRGLDHLNTSTLLVIHRALTESSLLKSFRLSEPPGTDRLTLLSIASRLRTEQPENSTSAWTSHLVSEVWLRDLGYQEIVVESTMAKHQKLIRHFLDQVPSSWQDKPSSTELLDARTAVRPLRDCYLAHHIARNTKEGPNYDKMARLIDLTLDLTTDIALVIKGSVVDAEDFRAFAREQAERYWRATLEGPRAAYIEQLFTTAQS